MYLIMDVRQFRAILAASARNCPTFTLKYIVMQMRKVNCEKGYWVNASHLLGLTATARTCTQRQRTAEMPKKFNL